MAKADKALDEFEEMEKELEEEQPKWEPPELSYVVYRGVIHGKKQRFNRVIQDLVEGGLKTYNFDWALTDSQGTLHHKCAYVPSKDDQALICYEVRPNPRNKKKKKLIWHRDYDIPGADHNYRSELAARRRRLLEIDRVEDWAVEDKPGEDPWGD
jgi:hypothetical protein